MMPVEKTASEVKEDKGISGPDESAKEVNTAGGI